MNDSGIRIPREQLQEFKRLYRKRFKREITDAQALDKATNLVNLVSMVYKPIKKKSTKQGQSTPIQIK